MNPYQRQAILNKTGKDPLRPKITLPKEYELICTRTGKQIIKGLYQLCKWKQKEEKTLNPLTKTKIKLLTT